MQWVRVRIRVRARVRVKVTVRVRVSVRNCRNRECRNRNLYPSSPRVTVLNYGRSSTCINFSVQTTYVEPYIATSVSLTAQLALMI